MCGASFHGVKNQQAPITFLGLPDWDSCPSDRHDAALAGLLSHVDGAVSVSPHTLPGNRATGRQCAGLVAWRFGSRLGTGVGCDAFAGP